MKKRMAKKQEKSSKKSKIKKLPSTMKLASERSIAMDFATKVYKEFDQMIKSVIMFGSSAKKISTPDSDIDIIIIIDDVAIQWDAELVAHYRGTLADVIKENPYKKSLHINTVKLSTWWQDLMRGDPIIVNILRYGDALIDFGGFFNPL
jgi:predicted nucleotidyltransferase